MEIATDGVLSSLLPQSSNTVHDWVSKLYHQRLPVITEKLKKAYSVINVSVDNWKSSNNNNFVAIVAHFINQNHKQDRTLISFPKIVGAKSGKNQAHYIVKVFATFGINASNLSAVAADNASDNDTALRVIKKLLAMPSGWAASHRIRYLGHIINLVVKALLFSAEEGRIRK